MAFTFIIVKEVRFFLNESQIVLQPCFKSQPAYRCGWLGFFLIDESYSGNAGQASD
jgi:hypothetical protein